MSSILTFSSARRCLRLRVRSTAYISRNFGSCFSPRPVSIRTFFLPVLIKRQVSESRMRFLSSAGMTFSHTGFGTMPNIAPPSSLNVPSLTACSSKSPSLYILSLLLGGCALRRLRAPPAVGRRQRDADHHHLTKGETDQAQRHAARESIGMQADAQLIDPEPGPADDDVSEDGQDRLPPGAGQSAPARVQPQRVPEDDHQRAVLLGV